MTEHRITLAPALVERGNVGKVVLRCSCGRSSPMGNPAACAAWRIAHEHGVAGRGLLDG